MKEVKLGIVGNGVGYERFQLRGLFQRAFEAVQRDFPDATIVIVDAGFASGLYTELYRYAERNQWETCHLHVKGTYTMTLHQSTRTEFVDTTEQDMHSYFLDYCDALVRIGEDAKVVSLVRRFSELPDKRLYEPGAA